MWYRNSDAVPRSESVCASRFQCRSRIAHQIANTSPRELSRTSKIASCMSRKDKLGTNAAQMLASVLQAASPELLKQAGEALCFLCPLARPISLYFIITSRI